MGVRDDHSVGVFGTHNGQRIGPHQATQGLSRSGTHVQPSAQQLGQQVGDDLGIGVRLKHEAGGLEIGTQFGMILDDAVVDDRDAFTALVGVGVAFGGHTVSRPSCMRNADIAGDIDIVE